VVVVGALEIADSKFDFRLQEIRCIEMDYTEESKVQVRFVSRHTEYVVPDTPILIPTQLRRYGLSQVINHLLDLQPPQVFDFLVEGHFLRTSLQKYLDENNMSLENVVTLEFVKSILPPEESAKCESDDWITAVRWHSDKGYFGFRLVIF
jgi:ribosome biogenesis protein YTM1